MLTPQTLQAVLALGKIELPGKNHLSAENLGLVTFAGTDDVTGIILAEFSCCTADVNRDRVGETFFQNILLRFGQFVRLQKFTQMAVPAADKKHPLKFLCQR